MASLKVKQSFAEGISQLYIKTWGTFMVLMSVVAG